MNFFVFSQVKRMKVFFGVAGRFAGRRNAARDFSKKEKKILKTGKRI